MNPQVLALASALAVAVVVALVVSLKYRGLRARHRTLAEKYRPVSDVSAEVEKLQRELATKKSELEQFLAQDTSQRERLSSEYSAAKATFERLRSEVSLLEENLEDISFGLYKPHYTFESSEQYKLELDKVYEQKKSMVRGGSAATCLTQWHVGNSRRDGERMEKQAIKVMLRAFNGEVDAAVAKVTWNNVTRMEERIRKAYDAINSTGSVLQVTISPAYRDAALAELRLTHEYEVKKHEEQQEQRQIREQMREEERAQREFEKAKADAAAEEARYQKALEKARDEVEKAKGAELDKVQAKVHDLEQKLAEAHDKMERAKSMAQLTKSGNVYVLSNIGSFGERVFKIGMTRRLDPMERVHELGDASVPFEFDVHAMIYSEDAPGLENAFHRQFSEQRVNLVNTRKEYFEVSLEDIEAFAHARGLTVEFTKLAEAREYRETLAIREQKKEGVDAPVPPPPAFELPDQLFAPSRVEVPA